MMRRGSRASGFVPLEKIWPRGCWPSLKFSVFRGSGECWAICRFHTQNSRRARCACRNLGNVFNLQPANDSLPSKTRFLLKTISRDVPHVFGLFRFHTQNSPTNNRLPLRAVIFARALALGAHALGYSMSGWPYVPYSFSLPMAREQERLVRFCQAIENANSQQRKRR